MTDARRPEGLLLDAMGTLIGLRRSVGSTYAAFAAEYGLSVEAEAINAVFPQLFRAAPTLAFPGLEGSALLEAEQAWWVELIAGCLKACGHEGPLPEGLGAAGICPRTGVASPRATFAASAVASRRR